MLLSDTAVLISASAVAVLVAVSCAAQPVSTPARMSAVVREMVLMGDI